MFAQQGNYLSQPVLSMPIRITAKSDKTPAKQTQIEPIYCTSLTGLGELRLLLREQTSFDLDKVIELCLHPDERVF
jgi:hypothetical protein